MIGILIGEAKRRRAAAARRWRVDRKFPNRAERLGVRQSPAALGRRAGGGKKARKKTATDSLVALQM